LNPTKLKIQAFILSAIPTGIIGGVFAYWVTFIDPASTLGDLVSDQALVMVVFGGMGTLIGPVVGAVLIFAFKTLFWAYLSAYECSTSSSWRRHAGSVSSYRWGPRVLPQRRKEVRNHA
jgi:branched-chain amino acid transport system permease protein